MSLNLKLDKISNESIKNSFLGGLLYPALKAITNSLSLLPKSIQDLFYKLLILSIIVLLGALSLPMFASDRFGIGLIIIFMFLIFTLNLNRIKDIDFNFIDILFISFLFLCTVSTFSSYFFKESLIGLFKYFIFFIGYLVIKFTFYNSEKKTLYNVLSSFFIFATITASIGIYQYIIGVEPLATWEDPNAEDTHTRVYSTLGNPNLLAGYLILALPIGLTLPFEEKSNLVKKIFYIICSLIVLLCLIFTGSRGGYIAFIAQLGASFFVLISFILKRFKSKNKKSTISIIIFSGVLLTGILMFMFPVITERLMTIFTLREHSSNSYRVNVWVSCLNMLKDNYFIGIGPGNATFRLAYGLYMISGFDALAAYNILLEFAVEAGILGFLIAILIFLTSFLKLHFIFWDRGSILGLGIFISLLGVFIHGMFDTIFFRPQVFIPFWVLIAAIAKLEKKS
jgi:putative inorganic carbon (HCO3(-)) transporter